MAGIAATVAWVSVALLMLCVVTARAIVPSLE